MGKGGCGSNSAGCTLPRSRLFLPAEFGPNRLVGNYSLNTQKPDGRFPHETVMGVVDHHAARRGETMMIRPLELAPHLITGLADIDNQHRALLALANEVVFAHKLDTSPELFRRAISFLDGYIAFHCAAEEAAMIQCKCPLAMRSEHLEFHGHLRRELEDIVTRSVRDGASGDLKLDIFFVLDDWLVYHVGEADHRLAAFLRGSSGGKAAPHLPEVGWLKASGALPADFNEQILAGVVGLQ